MPALSASAPGKTILFGEHAVVYGYPAIAVPLADISLTVIVQALPNQNGIHILNQGLHEDFSINSFDSENRYSLAIEIIQKHLGIRHMPAMQLTITSKIPLASGLGSSAAFAVALTKAVTSFLGFKVTLEMLNKIAFEIEQNQHGTPSGIDNTVVSYQKPVFFRKNLPPEFIKVGSSLTLVLANSGIRSLTKESVSQVRELYDHDPEKIGHIFDQIGSITEKARKLFESGDHKIIGELMIENHHLLKKLDVSLDKLDHLVGIAVKSGAYGAKLCGGGKGGNVVALVPPDQKDEVAKALVGAGAESCLLSTVETTEGIL